MKMGWFIGSVAAFVLLTLIFAPGQMIWVGDSMSPLFVALNPFKYGASAWWGALETIFTFKYTFFTGGWEIARWILLTCIGAGFMIGIGFYLIQGLLSAVGSLFRAVVPR